MKNLKKKNIYFVLMITAALLIFGACEDTGAGAGDGPDTDQTEPQPPSFIFDGDRKSSRSLNASRDTTLTSDESLQALKDVYDTFGTLVGAYTPTKFSLFVHQIALYNEDTGVMIKDAWTPLNSEQDNSFADFAQNVKLDASIQLPEGTYTGMHVMFFQDTVYEPGGETELESEIEVTIPGYEGIFPDLLESNLSIGSKRDLRLREELSPGTYWYQPWYIQPTYFMESETSSQVNAIGQFYYMKDKVYSAILPGVNGHPDMWLSSDPDGTAVPVSVLEVDSGDSAIIVPFDGVTITADTESVTFTVGWDIQEIIHVYDNTTTDDKTDDIVVFAPNFWERFTLTVETVEAAE